jgi:hypothetical protein
VRPDTYASCLRSDTARASTLDPTFCGHLLKGRRQGNPECTADRVDARTRSGTQQRAAAILINLDGAQTPGSNPTLVRFIPAHTGMNHERVDRVRPNRPGSGRTSPPTTAATTNSAAFPPGSILVDDRAALQVNCRHRRIALTRTILSEPAAVRPRASRWPD